MNTRRLALSLSLLLVFLLAACSPKASASEPMADKDGKSESAVMEKDDEMDSKSSDAEDSMSESGDEMSGHDDSMKMDDDKEMEDKDVDMISEGEDDMSDKDDSMMDKGDDSMKKDDAMMETDEDGSMGAMEQPAWIMTDLVDASTGNVFQVADFKGNVILVETLAMWCSNCLKQQGQVKELHNLLGERDDFISLGIDIDPNEDLDTLKGYINNHGFDWHYTVAPVEVARGIGQLYGDQYLNPPSTPMLIIDRDGQVHLLPFGIKDAGDLYDALEPFLESGM